jgi:hypothetical protein
MLTGGPLGTLDLVLSLAYAALFLVLIGFSFVAFTRCASGHAIAERRRPHHTRGGEDAPGGE